MAKVILICGKICSGKSTYAERIRQEHNAVILSHDELMLALFDPLLGDKHDAIADKASAYLFEMAFRLVGTGADVILDWGFWTKEKRDAVTGMFEARGIEIEWHYVHAAENVWRRNIGKRNRAVENGETSAYYVDEGLLKKLESRFEEPDRSEMDVWYENDL